MVNIKTFIKSSKNLIPIPSIFESSHLENIRAHVLHNQLIICVFVFSVSKISWSVIEK